MNLKKKSITAVLTLALGAAAAVPAFAAQAAAPASAGPAAAGAGSAAVFGTTSAQTEAVKMETVSISLKESAVQGKDGRFTGWITFTDGKGREFHLDTLTEPLTLNAGEAGEFTVSVRAK